MASCQGCWASIGVAAAAATHVLIQNVIHGRLDAPEAQESGTAGADNVLEMARQGGRGVLECGWEGRCKKTW